MTPYYERDGITIYCGDCLEVMPKLEPGFDVCITDPPYGIDITSNSKPVGIASDKSRKATNETWDDSIPDRFAFSEIMRLSEHQIIFGANYFLEYLKSSSCYIVWDKRGSMPHVPFAPTEWAWTSFDGRMPKKYTVINHGFIKDSPEMIVHPTQKPLKLMLLIISDFTSYGDLILDPYMGSGTTLVAAQNEGRCCTGIELSEEYCRIAVDRLRQPSFFSIPSNGKVKAEAKQLEIDIK